MKTFIQFLDEQEHSAGDIVHDWGLIHPHTGEMISGQSHPTAHTHGDLHHEIQKKSKSIPSGHFPEYVHYKTAAHGQTLHVRSYKPEAHKALATHLKHLPTASHFEHDYRDKRGNASFKEFDSERSLQKHVSNLAK